MKKTTTLEEDLHQLQKKGEHHALSIHEILKILARKDLAFILMILSLPFCQPIQIPGLSTPFGLVIAFVALRMVFRKDVWLPKKILCKEVPSKTLKKITDKMLWLVRKIRHFSHPRLRSLCTTPIAEHLHGFVIFLLGIFLALPLPIPFTNLAIAWPIFLIAFGILEDDGVFVIAGYVLTLLAAILFTFIGISAEHYL